VEESIMPNNKKSARTTEPAADTQKLYAHAYASRLARQVAQETERPRRPTAPKKKTDRKEV
jgi:hypothetical protein